MLSYYFEISLQVDSNYDLLNIEKDLGFMPNKIISKEVSFNPKVKHHVIAHKTPIQDNPFIEGYFTQFLKKMEPKLAQIKQFAKQNKASIAFYAVVKDKSELENCTIGLEPEAIKVLAALDASWHID